MAKANVTTDTPFRISLIGAETMLGKDIQDALERGKRNRVTTYSASGEGTFGEQDGEGIYLSPFSETSLSDRPIVVLAGSEAGARKSYDIITGYATKAPKSAKLPVVIDTLGFLGSEKSSSLTSTLIREVHPKQGQLLCLAHPVASALTLVLSRLANFQTPVRAVANVFEPASERGQRGIDELHKQTAALLAFKPLPKEVFDAQLAFNSLAKLGGEAKLSLADIEQRIYSQIQQLAVQTKAQAAVAQLSLRLVQIPVFHGYSISLFVEFATRIDRESLEEALASAQIEVRGLSDETPDAVAAVGSSGVMAGDIRVDTANPKAAWFWLVFDNLRLLSDSVADIVTVLAQEP